MAELFLPLTALSEAQRAQALERFTIIRPARHAYGIPTVFYSDHGSDFTSKHMEQVAADLPMELIFSQVSVPRGRGKIERFFRSVDIEKPDPSAANGQGSSPLGKVPGQPHLAQTVQAATSVPASKPLPLPQVAPKPTKARVGQRGNVRDPVGETSAPSVRTAIGCAFTEVIAVTQS
jgi:transposase InsO family protein